MKKSTIVLACTISAIAVLPVTYAGSMGPISTQSITPYIEGEASYTWNSASLTLNSNPSKNQLNGWGGRFSAGVMLPYTERVRFNMEVGGGYYGSKSVNVSESGLLSSRSIDGYDILVGVMYKINQFDLVGDVGFMSQNYRRKRTIDFSKAIPGGAVEGFSQVSQNFTQTLPEIKVGGIYNINDNIGLTLSYLHVFGVNDRKTTISIQAAVDSPFNSTASGYAQNPTLNSVMFGVRYSFV